MLNVINQLGLKTTTFKHSSTHSSLTTIVVSLLPYDIYVVGQEMEETITSLDNVKNEVMTKNLFNKSLYKIPASGAGIFKCTTHSQGESCMTTAQCLVRKIESTITMNTKCSQLFKMLNSIENPWGSDEHVFFFVVDRPFIEIVRSQTELLTLYPDCELFEDSGIYGCLTMYPHKVTIKVLEE